MPSQFGVKIEALNQAPAGYFDDRFNIEAIKIVPGQYYVTRKDKMIVTVLGTCVGACIRDRVRGIGGMNHFMLADWGRDATNPGSKAAQHACFAMDKLIEQLLAKGAQQNWLEAKIFGGADLLREVSSVNMGQLNISFLTAYLRQRGIKVVADSLGGAYPRKVYFFPRTGEVMVRTLTKANNSTIVDREKDYRIRLNGF
jgi:chemotaxis protein CheD